MGNTTFSGPVRSEGGFEVITKNATTGAITTDADITTTSATFTGPLKSGTTQSGSSANVGLAVLSQTNTVARTDTTDKDLFIVPANAEVIGINVLVETASDAGTSATVTVKAGATSITTGTSVTATGKPTVTAANVGTWEDVGASDATIKGIYAESGTASTTGGPFRVTMYYVQK